MEVGCWRKEDEGSRRVAQHKQVRTLAHTKCRELDRGGPTVDGVMSTSCDLQHSANEKSSSPNFTDFCNSTTTLFDGTRRGQVLGGGCGAIGWRQVGPFSGSVFSARRVRKSRFDCGHARPQSRSAFTWPSRSRSRWTWSSPPISTRLVSHHQASSRRSCWVRCFS